MNTQRRLALAVSLLAVGLGAGHLVQSGATQPEPSVSEPKIVAKHEPVPAPTTALPLDPASAPQNLQQLAAGNDDLAAPSAMPPVLGATSALPAAPALTPATPKLAAPVQAAATSCDIALDLLADSNAMIGLTLIAPCRANQRVMVKHGGLAITAKTSATGSMFLNLPAMEVQAKIELTFPDGEKLGSVVEMPEVAGMQRFAVQWLERDAFQLHAFENGADYGQPGHVSAIKPQTPAPGLVSESGFVTLLGDSSVDLPMLAEVYTFPAQGAAEVLVEAAVTPETCGRELLGETVSAVGGEITVSELTLAMPECTAAGDILVLKNLVPEMKLAAR